LQNKIISMRHMMKWINGRTYKARDAYLKDWHKWFAWHPVIIGTTGEGKEEHSVKVWLQYLERKGTYYQGWGGNFWVWEYREIGNEKD